MKYSLDISFSCNDSSILDKIFDEIPIKTDARVCPEDYRAPIIFVNPDTENLTLSALIRFYKEADRDKVADEIEKISGVLTACEIGKQYGRHDCVHPRTETGIKCQDTFIVRVI